MKRDFEVRFFDRGSNDLIHNCWAWVADRNGEAVGVLTVELRDDSESKGELFSACAQVRMICARPDKRSAGVASWLVRQAIKYLDETHGLKLYRSGHATAGGRRVLENLGVAVDPLKVRAYERYLDELAACSGSKEECLAFSPIEEYSTEEAEKKCSEDLGQAQMLLGLM